MKNRSTDYLVVCDGICPAKSGHESNADWRPSGASWLITTACRTNGWLSPSWRLSDITVHFCSVASRYDWHLYC